MSRPPPAPLHGVTATQDYFAPARALAERLALPLLPTPPDPPGLYLLHDHRGLALCQAGRNAPGPVRVALEEGRQGSRLQRASIRREALARACGLRADTPLHVVDATAGLGRDGLLLAILGAHVTLLERHPVIAALLEDGLKRIGATHPELAGRLQWQETDSMDWLAGHPDGPPPQVICLDPMYPAGSTRGAVRKDLQSLRDLGDWPGLIPVDECVLLERALHTASQRVVVKRPGRAAPLAGLHPDWQIPGRSTRFDVYRGQGAR